MNKLQVLLLIATLSILSVQAQETEPIEKGKTTFGIKGGISFNTIRGAGGLATTDFYGGFFATTRISEKWSFQNELALSLTDEVAFVEIPLFMKYHINDKWSIFGGPRLDMRASRSYDTQLIGQNGEVLRDVSASDDSPLGVSLELGAQYDITKKFFVEARYSYGLIHQLVTSSFGSGERSSFRLGVGYKF